MVVEAIEMVIVVAVVMGWLWWWYWSMADGGLRMAKAMAIAMVMVMMMMMRRRRRWWWRRGRTTRTTRSDPFVFQVKCGSNCAKLYCQWCTLPNPIGNLFFSQLSSVLVDLLKFETPNCESCIVKHTTTMPSPVHWKGSLLKPRCPISLQVILRF